MRLQDKVAVITGASSGIGRATALLFAKEGAKIVLVDINDAGGQETLDMITATGGEAIYIHADQSKAAEVEGMIAATEGKFGRLDILFNNAGISHAADDNAVNTSEEVWDLTFDINVKGVFLCCKYGIPALRRAGGGSIINTASFVAEKVEVSQNMEGGNSAETIYLLRYWQESDNSPRYLLETVQADPQRRLFTELPALTTYLTDILSHKKLK